jgi:two-component system, chemotaxis family, sensor kinase Cph1
MEVTKNRHFKKSNSDPANTSSDCTGGWLGLALKAANMSAYKWDLKTSVVAKSNQSAMDSVAHPPVSSWLYDDALKYIYQADRELVEKKINEAIDSQKDFNIEYRARFQNDEIRWLQSKGHAVYGDDGRALYVLAVTQDITKRKEDELSLQNQKRELEITKCQLKLAIESAGMVALPNRRPNENYIYKSPEMCRLLGIENEDTELSRELVFSLIHPDDRQRVLDVIAEATAHGGPIDLEYRVSATDGQIRWIMLKGAHIMDDQGGAKYIVLQNVTSRKNIEEQIKQKNHELSVINEKLDRFSSIVAHDLKSPLNTILMAAQLISKTTTTSEVAKWAELINSGATRMAKLISDLLEFAKSEHDTTRPKETVSLSKVVETVQLNLKAAIADSNAKIQISSPLPFVLGHPTHLIQLFQNLISNALKFRSEHAPEIFLEAKDSEDHWLFTVRDNGLGIDPSLSQRMFEPFQRLHSKVEGSGLGLSICKTIVEIHNGRIWVESEVGGGSRFFFTLAKT